MSNWAFIELPTPEVYCLDWKHSNLKEYSKRDIRIFEVPILIKNATISTLTVRADFKIVSIYIIISKYLRFMVELDHA